MNDERRQKEISLLMKQLYCKETGNGKYALKKLNIVLKQSMVNALNNSIQKTSTKNKGKMKIQRDT